MELLEHSIPSPHDDILESRSLRADNKLRVRMISYRPLHARLPHARNIHIPPVDNIPLWHIREQPVLISLPIRSAGCLNLVKCNLLLISARCWNPRVHHQFHNLLGLQRQLPPLRLLMPVLRGRNPLRCKRFQELPSASASIPTREPWFKLTTCSLSCQNSFSFA